MNEINKCNERSFQRQRGYHKAEKFKGYRPCAWKNTWKQNNLSGINNPPANVYEMDDKYELSLVAPGFQKDDFIIAIMDQILSITVSDVEEKNQNWKRREYAQKGFVRQFELTEKVDKTSITAKYENGVLVLNLPKTEGSETVRQKIAVA